ncbi:hypothetical protein BGX24_000021 [Mortierella sp. AD032]|nr:hypothetical protein BGX24_000021 [Mortierella sp. AD032]
MLTANTTTSTRRLLYKFSLLRELVLRISFNLDDTLNTFPYPATLTSLDLDLMFPTPTTIVDLDPILQSCPLLEVLTVKANRVSGHWMVWTILEQHDRQGQDHHLRLRSLILKNIGFPQPQLENVLHFTPALKVLKLMSMEEDNCWTYDWTRLMDLIKTLGIQLNAADFSIFSSNSSRFPEPRQPASSSSPELAPRVHEICPSTTDWTFDAATVTPSFLKTLSLRTSFVTTLELYWKPAVDTSFNSCCTTHLKDAPRLIHEYLCTSPQLVHLRTLKAPIRVDYMDLFGRRTGNSTDNYKTVATKPPIIMPSPHPAIWMCRGLKTLHIELHGNSNPRVLFGYISRVLPHLEELHIARPYVCESESGSLVYARISLLLRDGFCLLSRLKHLERLFVVPNVSEVALFSVCNMMDLSWLLDSTSSSSSGDRNDITYKAQRRKEVERWLSQREREDYQESARPPGSIELLSCTNASEEDREIWHQLRHLGMYLDVEEMVREMDDSEGFRPLPSLCQLSLGSFFMQQPKVELDFLFSDNLC